MPAIEAYGGRSERSTPHPATAAAVRIKALVLDSPPSPESKRAYGRALDDFLEWCQRHATDGFTKATVNTYRADLETRGLSPSTSNLHLSAIRKLALEAADNRESCARRLHLFYVTPGRDVTVGETKLFRNQGHDAKWSAKS